MSDTVVQSRLQSLWDILQGYHSSGNGSLREVFIDQLITNSLAGLPREDVDRTDLSGIKDLVNRVHTAVWDSNSLAWLHLSVAEPSDVLHSHSIKVLEIVGDATAPVTRQLLERVTKEELLLALQILEDSTSIKDIVSQDPSGNMDWQTTFLVAVSVVAVAASIWLFWRRGRHSKDFRALAPYSGSSWARKLCESGPSHRTFQITEAWHITPLSDEEKSEAIPALAGLQDYSEIVPSAGSEFDELSMSSGRDSTSGFVYSCIRPGLRYGEDILEKALIDAGSSDYVAMKSVSSDPITSVFLEVSEAGDRPDPSFRIGRSELQALYLRDIKDSDVQDWLAELVRLSPAHDLSQVEVEHGTPFIERLMVPTGEMIADRSNAVVAKVLHRGLLRDQTVLLRARVLAAEPETDRYGDL